MPKSWNIHKLEQNIWRQEQENIDKQKAKTTNWLQYPSRREEEKESRWPSDLTDKGYLELCDNMAGIDLLQELKNMEQRITATLKNDKESEITSMEERLTNNLKHTIDQSMKEAIQSLTSQSAQTISNQPTVQQNFHEIQNLKEENTRLTKQVQILSS